MISAKLKKNTFLKNASLLVSGAFISQVINLLVQPIFSRLFLPEYFGKVVVFNSMVSIGTILCLGGFEQLILKDAEKTRKQYQMALTYLFISALLVLIALAIVYCIGFESSLLKNIGKWLFAVPVAIFFNGFIVLCMYNLISLKSYGLSSVLRVVQVVFLITFNFLAYFFINSADGLVFSQFLTYILTSLSYFVIILYKNSSEIFRFNFVNNIKSVRKHDRTIFFLGVPAILDIFALQIPVFFVGEFFGQSLLGALGLAIRATSVPVKILSTSLYQLFMQKLSESKDAGEHRRIATNLLIKLFSLSILIFSPVVIWGEDIFSFVFGSEWLIAGKIARFLGVSLAFKLAVGPILATLIKYDKLKTYASWRICNLIASIGVAIYASLFELDVFEFLLAYVSLEVILLIIIAIISIKAIRK